MSAEDGSGEAPRGIWNVDQDQRKPSRKVHFRQPGAQVAVGLLAAFVVVVGAVWTPSLDAHAVDSSSLLEACRQQNPVPCVQQGLEEVLMAQGSETAFGILGNLTASDSRIAAESHGIAHQLGRVSVRHYSSPAEALRHCPTTMASGCFHGVLERHFADVGAPEHAADLTRLCTAADGQNRFFQCLHGLGHGLMMVANHDLPRSLAWCSMFSDSWMQDSCAGGVFMENIVGDTSMQHHQGDGAPEGHHGHDADAESHGHSTWVRMKPEDPLYPCNAVAERWWHSCYWMQSSLLLKIGKTIPQAFAACDLAPKGFNATCYESMGRDIAGTALFEPGATIDFCMLGEATLRGRCIYGAAQTIVNNDGKADPGLAFCKAAPLRLKTDCYTAVGSMIRSLVPDPKSALQECNKSEPRFRQSCLKAALG